MHTDKYINIYCNSSVYRFKGPCEPLLLTLKQSAMYKGNKTCLWNRNAPQATKSKEIDYFHSGSHKIIDLGAIWKGFIRWVYTCQIYSTYLLWFKIYDKGSSFFARQTYRHIDLEELG